MIEQSAPKTVVLTPVHNGEAYLREALDSVQAQTYPNLVHFVLDNASTDRTPGILQDYKAEKVRLVVARSETLLPIAQNWNRALKLGADGAEYFRILCADDTMPPEAIEKMVRLAATDKAIALVGSHRKTSDSLNEYSWDEHRRTFPGKEAIRTCFLIAGGFAPTHLLYGKAVLALRPDLFDPSVTTFDTDAAFYILSQPGVKFAFIPETLGFTRRHADTMTQRVVHKNHSDYFDWLGVILRYGRYALSERELQSYKRAFRRHYLSRLLVWRFRHGNRAAFDWHRRSLREIGESPGLLDYLDTAAAFGLRKVGLGSRWNRYPQG